jgi:GTPase Era involved in 16S rRNA processing
MIERTCKIGCRGYGPYRDISYAQAAKKAVLEHVCDMYTAENLPVEFSVEVTDTESGQSRWLRIEASLRLEWTNPRQVAGD